MFLSEISGDSNGWTGSMNSSSIVLNQEYTHSPNSKKIHINPAKKMQKKGAISKEATNPIDPVTGS